MGEKDVGEKCVNKFCKKVLCKESQIQSHLHEDFKEKIEEFNPLFVVDEDLEGCAPDSKFVIEKMVQQLNLRVVKHCLGGKQNRKIFLRFPLYWNGI